MGSIVFDALHLPRLVGWAGLICPPFSFVPAWADKAGLRRCVTKTGYDFEVSITALNADVDAMENPNLSSRPGRGGGAVVEVKRQH